MVVYLQGWPWKTTVKGSLNGQNFRSYTQCHFAEKERWPEVWSYTNSCTVAAHSNPALTSVNGTSLNLKKLSLWGHAIYFPPRSCMIQEYCAELALSFQLNFNTLFLEFLLGKILRISSKMWNTKIIIYKGFIPHSFNKYLLRASYVPDSVLGPGTQQ